MAEAHHFGDAARVVFVGLDGARGQEALGMARLNAHDRYYPPREAPGVAIPTADRLRSRRDR